ncbi:HNH endonuclease, partial [Mycolicibacterium parafortuitum]
EWAATVIDTALRVDRRMLLPNRAGGNARAPIPQHVKAEVWQRDGGRCVDCGSTEYLEYDSIIPKSKGGADSERNLQILCRRCNLAKSDRI